MIGVAVERWDWDYKLAVENWLTSTYGKSSDDTWYYDYDYDLHDLVMSDDIYLTFTLKWLT